MKKVFYAVCAVAIICCAPSASHAQKKKRDAVAPVEQPKMEGQQQPNMDMMMKKWQEYMTPGEFHKWLEKNNGTWDLETTMWMDPSQPPTKSKGTCENTMIMGGRYQQSMNKGDFNGMPFEGISTVGYDNAKMKFVSTWIDNMGTGITYMEGTFNKEKNMLEFSGMCMNPMVGKDMKVRETFHIIDDNTQMMEWYETRDGKEMKTMEIKFTRRA